jgi:aquaporin Z
MEFKHSTLSRYLSEATGTFFLVLTAGCNVLGMTTAGAISVGGMLMCMIYALGSVSGAHFNPAVTLAIYLSGRSLITLRDVGGYMLSQLTGGILAGLLCEAIFRTPFTLRFGDKFADHHARVMAVEVMYTMALCYVVLNVATTASQANNQYFGMAIGFTVLSAAIAIGVISNCCLNPAVALGSLIASKIDSEATNLKHYYVYFLMPLLGSFFGALAFYMVRRKDEYEPKNWGFLEVKKQSSAEVANEQSGIVERSSSVAQVGLTNSDDER